MILENLAESISNMPSARLLELLAKVRESRKTEKEIAPASKGTEKRPTKQRETKSNAIATLLGGMGEEQLAMLAATLKDDPVIKAMLEAQNNDTEDVQFPTSPPDTYDDTKETFLVEGDDDGDDDPQIEDKEGK